MGSRPGPERPIEEAYFRHMVEGGGPAAVDDVTAADLDLDRAFLRLDKTRTSPGQAMLYHDLRVPCSSGAELSSRLALSEALRGDDKLMAKLDASLGKLGRQKSGDLANEIWGWRGLSFERYRWLFYAWVIVALAAIAVSAFVGLPVIFVVILILVINIAIYAKTTPVISTWTGSIYYLCSLIRGARNISRTLDKAGAPKSGGGAEPLAKLGRALGEGARRLKRIPRETMFFRASANFGGDLIDALLEYLRIFFLRELFAYFRVYEAFEREHDVIEALYRDVGRLDAALSLARALEAGTGLCRAQLVEAQRALEVRDLVHPLVEACVPNSVAIERGLVITGTNMAGKSTFLKALGLSQILAASFGLAYAREFRTGFFLVMSSMTNGDDIASRKSRYFVEAERMLSIVKASAGKPGLLALVDEMLVGTNSEDRIAASVAILRSMARGPSLAVAATHDLPIAQALVGVYDSYHFSEILDGADLQFDYLIKPGIVDKKNAIDILKYLGFDEELLGR